MKLSHNLDTIFYVESDFLVFELSSSLSVIYFPLGRVRI